MLRRTALACKEEVAWGLLQEVRPVGLLDWISHFRAELLLSLSVYPTREAIILPRSAPARSPHPQLQNLPAASFIKGCRFDRRVPPKVPLCGRNTCGLGARFDDGRIIVADAGAVDP